MAASDADSWRTLVTQQSRSSEIREVSKVLAALEPGAISSSKMMLATQFEKKIFESAKSLADYRKRIAKRLKKLQKSYVPAANNPELDKKDHERMERDLRNRYGEMLIYICRHAPEAIEKLREKKGIEHAQHLKQHTNNAEQWSVDLSLIGEGSKSGIKTTMRKYNRDGTFFDKLSGHLKDRVENIRRHVVSLTDPDLLLEEHLAKLEDEMSEKAAKELSVIALKVLNREKAVDVSTINKIMERVKVLVPPSREGHDQDIKEASLLYLDKIRAACQLFINYMALDSDGKAQNKQILKKAHVIVVEGLNHIIRTYKEKDSNEKNQVKLEDAWNNFMEYLPSNSAIEPIN